jgi:anti-sigma regulatory factor (Ser/Thr protein kinase)
MLGSSASLRRQFAASPENVREARRAVAGFLDGTAVVEEQRAAILLSVSEAVTNAVVHAYRNGVGGEVAVAAYPDEGYVVIVVRDYGLGMCPNPESPGLGVGLSIIAASCERLEVRHRRPGTELEMRFRLD